MNDKIEDIVAEIREAEKIWHRSDIAQLPTQHLKVWADRIEAAMKRERERGSEAAQICGELGEAIGRASIGNAANMREAMDAVIKVGDTDGFVRELNNIFTFFYRITVAIRKCREAISTPPRNCDWFATAKEAREAWMSLDDDSDEALNSFEWMYSTVAK